MTAPSPSSPPALTSISIAGRAAHAFTTHAMLQGLVSHGKGVEILASARNRFAARVRSKRSHDVTLRAERGRLIIACSCPARSLGLQGCKHAWAALLEADRQAALIDLRGSRSPLGVDTAAPEAERPASAEKSEKSVPAAKAARPRPGIAKVASSSQPARASAKPAASETTPAPPKSRRQKKTPLG